VFPDVRKDRVSPISRPRYLEGEALRNQQRLPTWRKNTDASQPPSVTERRPPARQTRQFVHYVEGEIVRDVAGRRTTVGSGIEEVLRAKVGVALIYPRFAAGCRKILPPGVVESAGKISRIAFAQGGLPGRVYRVLRVVLIVPSPRLGFGRKPVSDRQR